jgi:hypothetical protein
LESLDWIPARSRHEQFELKDEFLPTRENHAGGFLGEIIYFHSYLYSHLVEKKFSDMMFLFFLISLRIT